MPNIQYDSYDERDVLIDYIVDSDLMTPDEELASEAMIARIQADLNAYQVRSPRRWEAPRTTRL